MALPDKVKQLDEQIAAAVRAALKGIREDLGQKLERNNEEIKVQLEQLEAALPASFLDAAEVSPIAEEASETSRRAALTDLRDSLVALDSTRSQAGILGALLEEAGRFASRTALFLTRKGNAVGWGSFGFNESPQDLSELTLDYDGPWGELGRRGGVLRLSASDCAPLCSFLDSEVPSEAVLVPIVLRDRLAAALYADGVEGAPALQTEALQTLAYVAAQAIEVLPFRQRRATPTLRVAEEAGDSDTALETWDDEPAAEAKAATAALPVADLTEALDEADALDDDQWDDLADSEAVVPELTEEDLAGVETDDEPTAEEAEEVEESEDDTAVEEDDEPTAVGAEFEIVDEESSDEGEQEDGETAEPEPVAAELEDPSAPIGFEPPSPEVDSAATVRLESLPEIPSLAPQPEPPAEEKTEKASPTDTLETEIESLRAATGTSAPEEVVIEPSSQEEEVLSPVDTEPPDIDISEDETMLLERETVLPSEDRGPAPEQRFEPPVPEPPPASPPPSPEPPTEPPGAEPSGASRGGSEVTPPRDVDGPGWAFSSKEDEAPDDGPLHDEARRLARLLVSEIRLYNEEQIEEGRRNRDIYQRVREDIQRSRQIYDERVDERVASSTDYFQDELIEILAGGDPNALGA